MVDCDVFIHSGARGRQAEGGRYGFDPAARNFLTTCVGGTLRKLYDLPENIQDVMGMQALRPSAVVCKVITIPNSRCDRIVTPDEHVSTGFHEILVNDMGQQDWPQVHLSDIGCL